MFQWILRLEVGSTTVTRRIEVKFTDDVYPRFNLELWKMMNDFSHSSISVMLSFIRFRGPSTEVRIWWYPSPEWRHWVRESLCLQHKQAFVVIESIVREPIFSESEQEPVFVAHEIPRFIEGDHHSHLSCFFVDFSYSDQRTNRFTSRACWNSRVRAHLEVSPSSLSSIRELLFCHRSSIIRFWITYTK